MLFTSVAVTNINMKNPFLFGIHWSCSNNFLANISIKFAFSSTNDWHLACLTIGWTKADVLLINNNYMFNNCNITVFLCHKVPYIYIVSTAHLLLLFYFDKLRNPDCNSCLKFTRHSNRPFHHCGRFHV